MSTLQYQHNQCAALVVLDGNLDPGGGSFSASIAAQTEAAYLATGYEDQIAALRKRARAGEPAVFVGMLQVAAPVAVHRTTRGLVDMPPPTVRTHFVRSTMPRSFLVGARTLEAETSSGAVEDWDFVRGLSDAGVRLFVVPDAGHMMMVDNPVGFAHTLAQALPSAVR